MRQENLQPPDAAEMVACPECIQLPRPRHDCRLCDGTGEVTAVPDRDDLDLEDDEDDFRACAECDNPEE